MHVTNKKIKIGVIGDAFTGKTNIINTFINHPVNENEISTKNYSNYKI